MAPEDLPKKTAVISMILPKNPKTSRLKNIIFELKKWGEAVENVKDGVFP